MKVILNQTVPKVGKEGTVVNVADGFARNYLFPRGLAIVADKKQIQALGKRNERVAAKTAGEKAAAEGVREKLNGQTVRIPGQVGAGQGKLFGAITSQDVADAVKKQLGVDVEKKKIALIEPIKRLGNHPVEIDLHREVDAKITVEVYDPAAPVEKPAPAPASDEDDEE
ncbi:50S ribosomal protein L9 [Fimbriimonas ginsengisoli]|uniref:Large ribosomal subunit protein bL9 n=1 Tax=Fimbriimonas ginsengisoli Gsoil 348 TaxID=661478 RepID=A0A068NK82_FIMGI|nr:50S ribosomal protein L9 [Fimbriimonas ginsengisoli]AIE83906.1 ribosomal protein L9 [Fimbriimonas ginsengisoli Gsoil 348]